jgi:putative ABC transport system ATP-binding protein
VNEELGTTTVLITHNAAIARMAERVIRISSGTISAVETNAVKAKPAELSW